MKGPQYLCIRFWSGIIRMRNVDDHLPLLLLVISTSLHWEVILWSNFFFFYTVPSVPLSSCDFYLINRQFLVPVTDLFIHPVAGNPRASREDGGTSSSGAPVMSWRYPVARGESVGVIIVQHGYSSPRRFVSLCSDQFRLLVIDLLTDWIQCSSSWGHRRDGVEDLDDDGCCDAHQ